MRSLFRPVVDFVSYRVFFFTGFPWTRGKPRRAVDGIRGKRKSPGAKKNRKRKARKGETERKKEKVQLESEATTWPRFGAKKGAPLGTRRPMCRKILQDTHSKPTQTSKQLINLVFTRHHSVKPHKAA